MKKNTAIIKKLLVVAIILAVVTISIISFVGVYTKNLNTMSDVIPDYTYSVEFEGNREYRFALDTNEEEKEVYVDSEGNIKGEVISTEDDTSTNVEVTAEGESTVENSAEDKNEENTEIEGYTKETRTIKANDDSVLTQESYKKSKSIIEKRLEDLGASQYNVRLDEVTGEIVVELPDDKDANFLYEALSSKGEFKIIDSQTGLELMNNSNIKTASTGYSPSNGSYTVYLQIQFDKEGTQILKDMSSTYVQKEVQKEVPKVENSTEKTENSENYDSADASTENNLSEAITNETEKETKYVELKLDNSTIMKTYFGEVMENGYIQIPLSQNITNTESLQNSLKSANAITVLLNSGNMPNAYTLKSDNFVQSTLSKNTINNIKISVLVIILVISLVLIIRFGLNGIIGAILNIGYLAIVLLAMRYTDVIVTISSLVAVLGIIIINTVFVYLLLNSIKSGKKSKEAYSESMKKIYLSIIPTCIVAFVFTFMQNASVLGMGSVLFWGLIIQALYSVIFIRSVYVLNDK